MLEYEKKIPLSKDEFVTLRRILNKYAQVHNQTNFYYDTDDLDMNRKGITCRIREKNGVYTATLKEHNCESKDCSIETSAAAKDQFDCSLFADKGVKLQGSLTTERIYLYRKNGLEIVMDKNSYLDFIDYEIEIEYSPNNEYPAKQAILCFADLLNAEYKEKFSYSEFYNRMWLAKSKSSRFFERLATVKK